MQSFVLKARRPDRNPFHDRMTAALANLPYRRWETWLPVGLATLLLGVGVTFSASVTLACWGTRPDHLLMACAGLADIALLFTPVILIGASKDWRVFGSFALSLAPLVLAIAVVMQCQRVGDQLLGPGLGLSGLAYLAAVKRYADSRGLARTALSFRRLQLWGSLVLLAGLVLVRGGPTGGLQTVSAVGFLVLGLVWLSLALHSCKVWRRELSVQP